MATQKMIAFRSYPKIIFAWPMAAAAFAAGGAMLLWPDNLNRIGIVFMVVSLLNLTVLAFEFSRAKAMTAMLGLLGMSSTLVLLNQRYPIFRPLHDWLYGRQIHASFEFYVVLGAGFFALFAGIVVRSRFDYWTLTASELVHRRGFLGESERFSTAGLKIRKEITDVLEYLLLGAGRIVITIPGQNLPVVLENVLGSHRVEKFAEEVLDARLVRLEETPARAQG